MTYSVTI